LSIDRVAASGVQSRYSPYAAMGNNPAILVDPDGLKFAYPVLLTGRAEHSRVIAAMEAEVEYKQNGRLNDMSRHLSVGGMDWGGGRSNFVRMGVLEQFAMAVLAAGGQVLVATGHAGVDRNDNSGGVGTSDGGMSGTLSEVTITGKKPGFFKKAWNWVKGFNFHFSLGGSVSFGAQLGLEGNVKGRRVGGEVNLTSIEIVGGDVDVTLGAKGTNGEASGSYWGKGGEMKVKQGVSGGIGIVSGEIEREFQGGSSRPNDRVTYSGAVGPLSGEYTQPLSPDAMTNGSNPAGLHLDVGAGVRFLIGIDIRVKLGVSHD
jgi:hypothetical protein